MFKMGFCGFLFFFTLCAAFSQEITRAETLRGNNSAERTWWDVQYYAIKIQPDFERKFLKGETEISFKVIKENQDLMQIDLQEPLRATEMWLDGQQKLNFEREGNAYHVEVPKQKLDSEHRIRIVYSGHPHEAKKAPWDGGFIFALDSLNRPWMTVACQGLGASVWYPCKDHQSDEPDRGASLTVTAPEELTVVANGRLRSKERSGKGLKTTTWEVVSPINNYCIIPYIGYYQSFSDQYMGEKGSLDVSYWAMDYHLDRAKSYFPEQVHQTLKSGEHWFGPYPFYEDGYQLVEAPHLGMEHQSAIAYGNHFRCGYLGRDLSDSGWGLKWDFIIVHESGHEWFGNNITANDIADMWIQESFTNYFETLFVDDHWGKDAADAYNHGNRKNILNNFPVIGLYGFNRQGSEDMYYKGANMLHSIRHSLDNDSLFRSILRGLNKEFYHQAIDGDQVEAFVSRKAGFDYQPVFNQYLRTVKVPLLEYYFKGNQLFYRYANCLEAFNLPLVWYQGGEKRVLYPGTDWKHVAMEPGAFPVDELAFHFYVEFRKINH